MEDIAIKLNKMGFHKKANIIVKAFDAIGNEYKSEKIKFNINKWFPGTLN